MNVIGFNFTKVSASRNKTFPKDASLSTDIEFLEIEKETVSLLKDTDPLRIDFRFAINYKEGEGKKAKNAAQILFEGNILLSATKEESKEIMKDWKKKKTSPPFQMGLFNLILKKCTVKALQLEEEMNLPLHHPVPQIKPKKKE